jgi:integrase
VAKKSANGEGSRPRRRPNGRWKARHWSDGKRRSLYGKTRKEVADKLGDALSDGGDAPVSAPTDVTVAESLARYEDAATYTMKRRSFETYQSIAKVHLLPAFGTIRLEDLMREYVQRMYSRKRAAGLSTARVRRIRGVLPSVLNRAVGWGLIERNVREQAPRRACPRRRHARSTGTRRNGS